MHPLLTPPSIYRKPFTVEGERFGRFRTKVRVIPLDNPYRYRLTARHLGHQTQKTLNFGTVQAAKEYAQLWINNLTQEGTSPLIKLPTGNF